MLHAANTHSMPKEIEIHIYVQASYSVLPAASDHRSVKPGAFFISTLCGPVGQK